MSKLFLVLGFCAVGLTIGASILPVRPALVSVVSESEAAEVVGGDCDGHASITEQAVPCADDGSQPICNGSAVSCAGGMITKLVGSEQAGTRDFGDMHDIKQCKVCSTVTCNEENPSIDTKRCK